jgi:hypothetical protein
MTFRESVIPIGNNAVRKRLYGGEPVLVTTLKISTRGVANSQLSFTRLP